MEKEELLNLQYQRAIDAKNSHNDNYNKWMVYYFTSIGAILVAISSFKNYNAHILLSILGVLISIFWHLSCKGFYYWTLNWMKIIKRIEIEFINDSNQKVFCSFSEKIKNDTNKNFLNPIKSANISTPKLTMLFAFISILVWVTFLIYILISKDNFCTSILKSISILTITTIVYLGIVYSFESIENDDEFDYF